MGSVAIFIDGGYLDKVVYFEHANKRLDYDKLVRLMSSPDDLLRAYYYHCLPYQGNPPTQDEKDRFASKQRFYHALTRLTRFQIRLGKLVCRGIDKD